MKSIASSFLAITVGLFAWGQNPPNDKPAPPTLADPGVAHPLPVPRQSPRPIAPDAKKGTRHRKSDTQKKHEKKPSNKKAEESK